MTKGEVFSAILMAGFIALAASVLADRQKSAVPINSWLQTDEFYVSSGPEGEVPVVSARFLILDESEGFWVSELQRLAGETRWKVTCSFAGRGQLLPGFPLDFSWYDLVEPSCALAPGQYRLKVAFVLARQGWQPKRLSSTSNVFTVGDTDG